MRLWCDTTSWSKMKKQYFGMDKVIIDGLYYPKDVFKVLIKTITYNQSKYIEETLDGIAMQKTSFPFVSIVLEDNSMDGEQDVIKTWLYRECDMTMAEYFDIKTANVIIVPHKTNTNCTFAIYFHKSNLYNRKDIRESQVDPWRQKCEYEAICEGDDYWIDSLKLQKQVDFLDANEKYVLSHTNHEIYNQSIHKVRKISRNLKTGNVLDLLLNRSYRVSTCTALYRIDAYNKIPKLWKSQNFKMGDLPLWIELAQIGGFHYLKDVTAVYRVLDNSASHSSNESNKEVDFIRSQYDVINFYMEQLHIPYDIERNNFNMYCTLLKRMYETENVNLACEYYLILKESSYDIPFKTKLFFWGTKYKTIRFIITHIYSLLK